MQATGISQRVSFAGTGTALDKVGTILDKVFTVVEKQMGYVFFYDLKLLREAKPVSVNAENVPLCG